jgi:hypothetical protein
VGERELIDIEELENDHIACKGTFVVVDHDELADGPDPWIT